MKKSTAKKPDPVRKRVQEMAREILDILPDTSEQSFRETFAVVAHHHNIFHQSQRETYNFYYRRVLHFINYMRRILCSADKTPKSQRTEEVPKQEDSFRELFFAGELDCFTFDPDLINHEEPELVAE